jgi:predicted house-cleaning noncanonical NTP pyrophosphatase (MazG superfamily)
VKLVRDGTQRALEGRNPHLSFKPALEQVDQDLLLYGKLMEEGMEWVTAKGEAQCKHELADILSVLWAMCKRSRVEYVDVYHAALGKERERGGFDNLIIMEVEADDDVKMPPDAKADEWPKPPASTKTPVNRQYTYDTMGGSYGYSG